MENLSAFSRFLHSPAITIRAGGDGHTLVVHEAALATSESPSLQKLVQPGWKESVDGIIDWSHTKLETVERVIAYLYFNDYESPDPVPKEAEPIDEHPNEELNNLDGVEKAAVNILPVLEGDPGFAVGSPAISPELETAPDLEPNHDPEPEHPLSPELEDPDVQNAIMESSIVRPLTPLGRCIGHKSLPTYCSTAGGVFQTKDFPYHSHTYQRPLSAHAEVYIFADCHHIPGLQTLTLQRTPQTLRKMTCTESHAAQEISELVSHAYNNTLAKSDGCDLMRSLLSQFVAINYTSLLHGSLEEMIVCGGDFTLDLGQKLSRRITAHGKASEIEDDELRSRIEELEAELYKRDESINSLTTSLNEALAWGRGTGRKNNRRKY